MLLSAHKAQLGNEQPATPARHHLGRFVATGCLHSRLHLEVRTQHRIVADFELITDSHDGWRRRARSHRQNGSNPYNFTHVFASFVSGHWHGRTLFQTLSTVEARYAA